MTIAEKVAYLKGLAEGLDIDSIDSKEAKLISAIIDVLEEVALDIADLEENALALGDELDELSEDLSAVEDYILEEIEDLDDDYDDDDDDDDDEPVIFNVTCPKCENSINFDESVLELGEIECPNCGEKLEFDISDCGDDCCCGHSHD